MKVRIEYINNQEDEVVIRTTKTKEQAEQLEKEIKKIINQENKIIFYKKETSYFLPLEEILFFETTDKCVYAHTTKDIYETKYRLYELEERLPGSFMRISKSTIVNIKKIYSMTNYLRSCELEFRDSHKKVFVSRNYYKSLKIRLERNL